MELLFLSALGSVMLTPLSMRLAHGLGAVDIPDGTRKRHAVPTPRLGGLALFLTVFVGSLLFLPQTPLRDTWLTGGALLCALGISDDIFSLSAPTKLLAEAAIATLPIAFGLAPRVFTLGALTWDIPHPLANALCLLWVLLLTNAFNLIDGIDTLCATQVLLSSAFFALFGNKESALLCGAVSGFLPYNRPADVLPMRRVRTRSFLGDTGALFLGFSLAVFSFGTNAAFPLFLPLLFAVPLFDCLFAFIRRAVQGKNPFSADNGHIHHLLLKRTHSAPKTVALLSLFSIAAIFCFLLTL